MSKLQEKWEAFKKWFANVWDFHKWKIIVTVFLTIALGSQVISLISSPKYDYTIGWAIGSNMAKYDDMEQQLLDMMRPHGQERTGNSSIDIQVYYADMMLSLQNSAYSDAGSTLLRTDFSAGICPFYVVTEDATAVAKEIDGMFYQEAYKFTLNGENMYIMVCRKTDSFNKGDNFAWYDAHMELVKAFTADMETVLLKPTTIV